MRWDVDFIDVNAEEGWPQDTPIGIRRYLSELVCKTPQAFVDNVEGVVARVMRVGDQVLPVMVCDGKGGIASILSPYGHHICYPVEEIARESPYLSVRLLHAFLSPLTLLLRAGSLDRVVMINHWLLSGSPEPNLPDQAWPEVLAFLSKRYPEHAIVLQDLKPDLSPNTATVLSDVGAVLIPSRLVHIVNPADPLEGSKNKGKRYKRNLARRQYLAGLAEEASEQEITVQSQRLCALYRASNVARHSALNPQYTQAFFELAAGCAEFSYRAWVRPGNAQIAAFNLQRLDNRFIHWSTFGVDPATPNPVDQNHSYYERAASTDLALAEETGLLLDWGGGAAEFKKLRGATEYVQYEAVIAEHLGWLSRLAWLILARLRTLRLHQLGRG